MRTKRLASFVMSLLVLAGAGGVLATELPAARAHGDREASLAAIRRQIAQVANRADLIEHSASIASIALADQLRRNRALERDVAAQRARMAELERSIKDLRD
jgi:hypothetical protein